MHTHGQAMDFYIPDVPLEQLRYAGLRLQRGGVGFYPTSGSPFVHLDTGEVRHWPDISRQELARVFPNGRTVHVPSDGLRCRVTRSRSPTLARLEPFAISLDAAQGAGIAVASNARTRARRAAKTTGRRRAGSCRRHPQNRRRRPTEPLKPCRPNRRRFALLQCRCRAASANSGADRRPAGNPARNAGSSGPWDAAKVLRRSFRCGRRQVRRSIDRRERFRRGVGLCTGVSSHRACIGRRGCDCQIDRRENLQRRAARNRRRDRSRPNIGAALVAASAKTRTRKIYGPAP